MKISFLLTGWLKGGFTLMFALLACVALAAFADAEASVAPAASAAFAALNASNAFVGSEVSADPAARVAPTASAAPVVYVDSGTSAVPVASAARDPFAPPEQLLCKPDRDAPPPRLRGIIGHQADYRAWLVNDGGKGRLWAARSWPDRDWQLQEVTALGVTLASATTCRPPLRINLQGSLYEKHPTAALSAGAVAGYAAARQPGAALPGL